MEKFKLAIGLHNHQPVGNFDFVFEDAHRQAYGPFIRLISNYPDLKFSLHQSGILWEWQKQNHPEYIEQIKSIVKSGQVDMMTGGFFEPILISIPESDAVAQIKRLTEFVKEEFDYQSKGLWLTERIWEPHLTKLLNRSGIDFLPIDDTHFIYAGFEEEQLHGVFVTEHENYSLKLLPISKKLRYLIPFGEVDDLINHLKKLAEQNPGGMAVYADDGEKFGLWPDTYEHCYNEGWLEKLFDELSNNTDWLEVISLKEAAATKPIGRAYLPSASYAEMLHWALPAKANVEYESFEQFLDEQNLSERYGRFVRGGHWRGFLTKYDEVNLMHKKMMHLSQRLNRLIDDGETNDKLIEAQRNLFAGQCNCPYWHGVFGGLYLPHIRDAVFAHLITAEKLMDEYESQAPGLKALDYDADGFEEIVVTTNTMTAVLKPNRGGSLVELSDKEHFINVADCLSRRKEGYHLKLDQVEKPAEENSTRSIHDIVKVKEPGLSDLLVEDWYLKRCFIDHIFTDDIDFMKFKKNQFGEYGDFVLEEYKKTIDDDNQTVTLTRVGNLWKPDGVIPCRIEKIFRFAIYKTAMEVEYQISVDHPEAHQVNFGLENNFNLQAGHADDRFILIDNKRYENSYLDSVGNYDGLNQYALVDEYRKMKISFDNKTKSSLWFMPLFTVSLSEAGFEKVFQGTSLLNLYKLNLTSQPTVLKFILKIDNL